MTGRPNIISIGEVLWDLFPGGERFGGAPANFACHAAILGAEVTMVSAVGDDARGREATENLRAFGIDTSLVQQVGSAPTGTVGIELDADGKPRFTIHDNSAWDYLTWRPEIESKIAAADAVYFGTLGQRGETSRTTIHRALETARTVGAHCVLDINLRTPFFDDDRIRDSIERATILKLSDDEMPAVAKACGISTGEDPVAKLRAILKGSGLESIIMTRGAEGALLVSAEEVVEQPGIPATIIDTVGAGDAFMAAFVFGLLRDENPETNLRNACENAAAVCSQPGAIPDPRQRFTP